MPIEPPTETGVIEGRDAMHASPLLLGGATGASASENREERIQI